MTPPPLIYSSRLFGADEMEAIYRLRYEIFCQEMGFLSRDACAETKEQDAYDERSDHIGVLQWGHIIAYARLIRYIPDQNFLIEESVTLPPIFDRSRTAEISRGFVVPSARKTGALSFLIESIFEYARANNIGFLLSFSNETMVRTWEKRKTPILYKGDCIVHHGFKTWPLIFPVS